MYVLQNMIRYSVRIVLYIILLLLVSVDVDSLGQEDNRRGRKTGKESIVRKHDNILNMRPFSSTSEENALQRVLDILNTPQVDTPPKSNSGQDLVRNWTDARIGVLKRHHRHNTTGKGQLKGEFGYHSPLKRIRGKLIHVQDTPKGSHYGCANQIFNKEKIPKHKPWVALISRGKCLFYIKIQLAQQYHASAVIIYDKKNEDVPVMNTVGE